MERFDPETGCRNTRSGGVLMAAPVLLALAFLVVSSLDLAGQRLTDSERDPANPRSVARPLTMVLTRAVRGLVGIQTQRPVARAKAMSDPAADRRPIAAAGIAGPEARSGHHVRVSLLNLPPPTARA